MIIPDKERDGAWLVLLVLSFLIGALTASLVWSCL